MAESGVIVEMAGSTLFVPAARSFGVVDGILYIWNKVDGLPVHVFAPGQWKHAGFVGNFPEGLHQDPTNNIWVVDLPKEIIHGIPDSDPQP